MILRELIRFLFPRQRLYLNHGRRVINPYDLRRDGTDEELTLMLAGIARSPDDARLLMGKYKTKSAQVVLQQVATRRKPVTFRQRLTALIHRLDGHDTRDVWGKPGYEPPVIRVEYRYRAKK